jgi:hypothetical protein
MAAELRAKKSGRAPFQQEGQGERFSRSACCLLYNSFGFFSQMNSRRSAKKVLTGRAGRPNAPGRRAGEQGRQGGAVKPPRIWLFLMSV